MRARSIVRWAGATALGLAAAACGAVEHPTGLDGLDSRISLAAALNPDSAVQRILIWAVDVGGALDGALVRLDQQIQGDDGLEWVTMAEDSGSANNVGLCEGSYGLVYGGFLEVRCVSLIASVEFGATYRVVASATGRPEAMGVTTVPGAFQVLEARSGATRDPYVLNAMWSTSRPSYRYLLSLIDQGDEDLCDACRNFEGWFRDLADTSFQGAVPDDDAPPPGGVGLLQVTAVDRALYDFITTGNAGDVFAVPPIQNVSGGFGVVGSTVVRQATVVESPGG